MLMVRHFTPIKCRCSPSSIGRLLEVFGVWACARIEQIITILLWYSAKVLRQLLASCGSIKAPSSCYNSGAAFCTHSAKADMSNLVISASGSNPPSPTLGLLMERSSVHIQSTNAESPMVWISCEACANCSTTSSRWYIPSDSAFAHAKHDIPYFLIGFMVTM